MVNYFMNDLDALCLRVISHAELQFQYINVFRDPSVAKKFQVTVIRDHTVGLKRLS